MTQLKYICVYNDIVTRDVSSYVTEAHCGSNVISSSLSTLLWSFLLTRYKEKHILHSLIRCVFRECDWSSQRISLITNACYQLTLIWCGLFFPCTITVCVRPSCLCILYTLIERVHIYVNFYCLLLLCTFTCFFDTVLSPTRRHLSSHTPHPLILHERYPCRANKQKNREKEQRNPTAGMNFLLLHTLT